MSSNKKIALTSAVLILLIIITAASIIAIFAAAQQTVNSEVSVTYKSEYVSGTASAKYYVGEADKTGTAMRVNGEADGATSIEFNSRNNAQTQTLSPVEEEIKLSEENYFVVFEYYFTNTNSQNDYLATLTTSESNVKNMTITTSTSDEKLEDFSKINRTVADITNLNLYKMIKASSNGFVYVRVEITNPDNDADFKINFNWNLGKYVPEETTDIWDNITQTFNVENFNNLLQTISGDANVNVNNMTKIEELAQSKTTAKQMRAFSVGKTAGKDITLTFGGLNWTATYLSTDKEGNPILTIWLDNCVQDAWKDRQADEGQYYGFLNGGMYSFYSANMRKNNPSDPFPSSMYGGSYIRAVTLNNGGIYTTTGSNSHTFEQDSKSVFAQFTMNEFGLTKYIVKPRQVEWQEKGQKAKTQIDFNYNLPNDNWSQELDSTGFKNNYSGKEYNDAWADDYLWLPSLTETGLDDSRIGIWNLSVAQRINADGSTESLPGNVGLIDGMALNSTWPRSGGYLMAQYVSYIKASGDGYSDTYANVALAVRPALHLNLRAVANAI